MTVQGQIMKVVISVFLSKFENADQRCKTLQLPAS